MSDAATFALAGVRKAMAADSAGEVMRGESASLDDVYAAEIQRLVALGTVLAGDGAAGEDLAHDAFLQLVQRIRREPDYLNGPAWPLLRTMVVRLAMQRRRAWARELRRLSRAWQPAPSESWEPSVATLDWHTALQTLPPRMRATVVLFYGEDLSTAQTATALGCSPRTVEIQLRAARRRLAAKMQWDAIEDDPQ
ncbi:MAG: sigma-70 family RNA polymerase sigma factor [Candidatus Dormibacteria bacterium]